MTHAYDRKVFLKNFKECTACMYTYAYLLKCREPCLRDEMRDTYANLT